MFPHFLSKYLSENLQYFLLNYSFIKIKWRDYCNFTLLRATIRVTYTSESWKCFQGLILVFQLLNHQFQSSRINVCNTWFIWGLCVAQRQLVWRLKWGYINTHNTLLVFIRSKYPFSFSVTRGCVHDFLFFLQELN